MTKKPDNNKQTDVEFEKTVDQLRALIGGSPVARTVVNTKFSAEDLEKQRLKKQRLHSRINSLLEPASDISKKIKEEPVKTEPTLDFKFDEILDFDSETNELTQDDIKPLEELSPIPVPTAIKTFKAENFLHLKKHSNEQAQALLQAFIKKHGKLEENSKEIKVLVKALERLIKALERLIKPKP